MYDQYFKTCNIVRKMFKKYTSNNFEEFRAHSESLENLKKEFERLEKFGRRFRSQSGDLNTRIEDHVTDAMSYGGREQLKGNKFGQQGGCWRTMTLDTVRRRWSYTSKCIWWGPLNERRSWYEENTRIWEERRIDRERERERKREKETTKAGFYRPGLNVYTRALLCACLCVWYKAFVIQRPR